MGSRVTVPPRPGSDEGTSSLLKKRVAHRKVVGIQLMEIACVGKKHGEEGGVAVSPKCVSL